MQVSVLPTDIMEMNPDEEDKEKAEEQPPLKEAKQQKSPRKAPPKKSKTIEKPADKQPDKLQMADNKQAEKQVDKPDEAEKGPDDGDGDGDGGNKDAAEDAEDGEAGEDPEGANDVDKDEEEAKDGGKGDRKGKKGKRSKQKPHCEYNLYLQDDTNADSALFQWYYFSVMNIRAGTVVRLNICNLSKPNGLYAKGMKPFVYST